MYRKLLFYAHSYYLNVAWLTCLHDFVALTKTSHIGNVFIWWSRTAEMLKVGLFHWLAYSDSRYRKNSYSGESYAWSFIVFECGKNVLLYTPNTCWGIPWFILMVYQYLLGNEIELNCEYYGSELWKQNVKCTNNTVNSLIILIN